jgi:hypothetical protein
MDYTKIYNQIIKRAQTRKLEGYVEKHHIVPKCMDGLDVKENLVELTAREHFLCHKLLCEMHPQNPKLWYALWLMAIGKQKRNYKDPYNFTSKEYERIKLEFIEHRKGKPISESHKTKISKNNSKQIIQYSTLGEYIKTFPSAIDAERHINQKPTAHWKELRNNINDCCRGKQKSAYGYIWKYEGDLLNLEDHKGSSNNFKGKQIQYDEKIYHNIEAFKKQFNLSSYMFRKLIKENLITYVNTNPRI